LILGALDFVLVNYVKDGPKRNIATRMVGKFVCDVL